MASAAVSTHTGGAGPLSLMSCVRESSPQESIPDLDSDKNVASKKKFWNPRKWFKRKSNKVAEDITPSPELPESTVKEALRSRSTSELSETDEPIIRRRSGTPMHPGLSVSHDSIFHSPNSGSELELEEAQSSSSLCIQHHPTQTELRLQTELSERLRIRRGRGDTSEDDEGLPRSPCNSPTATEGLLDKTAPKHHPTKSHSTCSDGSLLSMGSSEIEEDSFGQQSSRHSSKLSLYDKKSTDQDSEWELGPSNASAPLNHSAAHHRVAVRPKRTHGAPRRKRMQPIGGNALPTTPEVNEDSSFRSLTPETSTKEIVTEVYSNSSICVTKSRTENQLKCSSLPPGLVGPGTDNSKLNRSRSSAGSKSQDTFTTLGEEDEDKDDKKSSDNSIFARLFPRRSGKKKKANKQDVQYNKQTIESSNYEYSSSNKRSYNVEVKAVQRSGPASRQRVQPIDIPATPEGLRREFEVLPEKIIAPSTSPLQLELENHLRQRMASSVLSSSPPKFSLPNLETPPRSPKSPPSALFMSHLASSPPKWTETAQSMKTSSYHQEIEESKTKIVSVEEKSSRFVVADDIRNKVSTEESKSKVKIAGLSCLQQRVLCHNDEPEDNTYKSLTDFVTEEQTSLKPVAKSHSFKIKPNESLNVKENKPLMSKSDTVDKIDHPTARLSFFKVNSLDNVVKNLDVPVEETKELRTSESSESLESGSSTRTSSTEYLDSLNPSNSITISGPSHTSVVSVSNNSREAQIVDSIIKPGLEKELEEVKEQQVSITKIQVKRESNLTTAKSVPEFLNVQLNKVDVKPTTNIVLTANLPSPKVEETKTVFNFDVSKEFPAKENIGTRKFSQDDIEVVDKDVNEEIVEVPSKNVTAPSTPNVVITSMTPLASTRIYKKNSEFTSQQYSHLRKSSLISVTSDSKAKLSLRTKSNSLDIVDSLIKQNSEPSSLDKLDMVKQKKMSSTTDIQETVTAEGVVLRRKSLMKHNHDEEPELMKVFARRSLKLKDGDDITPQVVVTIEDSKSIKSKDSDKENRSDSPMDERKKPVIKDEKPKEPLTETKFVETTEVTLRKPINNKLFAYQQRTVSLSMPKVNDINTDKSQKNLYGNDRPKTEITEKVTNKTWITTVKKESEVKEELKKISCDEVITDITSKSDFINEDFPTIPKNFNQRKAEWEKRAQEALKKSVP